jgi:hypothetical protein
MGRLTPGVTYIYEKADGITYAREFGAPPSSRFEIGRDYERYLKDELRLWESIVQESRNNPSLHEALERAKVIYYISKEDGNSKT